MSWLPMSLRNVATIVVADVATNVVADVATNVDMRITECLFLCARRNLEKRKKKKSGKRMFSFSCFG